MAKPSRLGAFTSTLSFRLFLVLAVSLFLLFTLHTVLVQRVMTASSEAQVKAAAYRNSDIIRRSLYTAMLRNERDRIREMITTLGTEPGVDVVRIYNKQGEITYSSVPSEVGTKVDRQAEACYVCHAAAQPLRRVPTAERARIYRKPDSHRVLGLINSIPNEASCTEASCHAHAASVSVLGVLDVQMSLAAIDAAGAAARRQALALAVGILLLSVGLMAAVLYRSVYRPTRRLREGTERLGAGDLTVTIDLHRSDELGELAASFNRMAASLRQADAELREWSRTLEDRVRQKTQQLEHLNAQLVQSERTSTLGRMAATVAHELNNPLSGILTYAKLTARRIRGQLPEGPERRQLLDALALIETESLRCGNIVRDLLTYARQRSAEFRPSPLHALVDQALALVAHHVELREIAMVRQLELADDTVTCDPEQIVQALLALLVNAVEAMGEGGRLAVRTWADGADADHVHLSVADTGVGIPPEIQKRIFDPFFSTKDAAKGVGLGLAVVYGIVQRHEGRIDVASSPGAGTTFTITLPRQPRGPAAAGEGETGVRQA